MLKESILAFNSYPFQCEGLPPCLYCVKKRQECVPQVVLQKPGEVFVNISGPLRASGGLSIIGRPQNPEMNPSIPEENFIKHFFSSFLVRNDLGGTLDLETIISSFQESPSLYNVILALGAFDLKGKLTPSSDERKGTSLVAFSAYRASIIAFQTEIENKGVLEKKSNLWTTFFLGLFEVSFFFRF
jgi:hypothetical protein